MIRRFSTVSTAGAAFWAALAFGVFAADSAQAEFLRRMGAPLKDPGARVLVMKPEITLYELTVSGLLEPKADWTEAAAGHVGTALREALEARGANMAPYREPTDPATSHDHEQLRKLHEAVGASIVFFSRLPTKAGEFDWTLGQEAGLLRGDSGAKYALFVSLTDSYATAGRRTLAALGGIFFGMVPGAQVGFASLVDLETGNVTWFAIGARRTGDLRTPEKAKEAVDLLLTGLPL